ncbi:low affinity immunoglobulin epsilon Fc receptor isoform X2 [Camelus dromedarius]|uniref:low affinity immunoglobulin epsilon Fc receptor isoform X2 n=1 Tax=Camelus dromedarius TaxID=9838 RepID=UPI00311946E3
MTPHGQAEGRGPGPALRHQDFSKFTRRRRCCRKGIQLALVGLVTAALWAGLLTLLLLWHWDTLRNLKQLEENAARNVTQVSKDLERHKGDEMAQKSQAAQMLQNMERIQAEQKRMESQEFELFQNLDGLRADLSNLKSLNMNERRMALESLERLQEEIQKLWVELRESNDSRGEDALGHSPPGGLPDPARGPEGGHPCSSGDTGDHGVFPRGGTDGGNAAQAPGEMLPPTLPMVPMLPTTVPATMPTTAPATVPTTVPTTAPTTVPAMVPTTAPATVPTTVPTTAPTTVPATVPTMTPAMVPTTVPATVPTTAPATVPTTVLTTAPATVPTMVPATAPTTAAPLSLSSTPGSTCNTCPEKWVSFQRKCYYFGEGAKKWIQARFACSNLHGRLVSIHSQEEQDFLTKHANKRGSWIGLRDLDIEGEFIWMDKKPLNYSNWQPGEPNDAGQGENCVMMQVSGQWNDAFCNNRLDGWVCDRLATC